MTTLTQALSAPAHPDAEAALNVIVDARAALTAAYAAWLATLPTTTTVGALIDEPDAFNEAVDEHEFFVAHGDDRVYFDFVDYAGGEHAELWGCDEYGDDRLKLVAEKTLTVYIVSLSH